MKNLSSTTVQNKSLSLDSLTKFDRDKRARELRKLSLNELKEVAKELKSNSNLEDHFKKTLNTLLSRAKSDAFKSPLTSSIQAAFNNLNRSAEKFKEELDNDEPDLNKFEKAIFDIAKKNNQSSKKKEYDNEISHDISNASFDSLMLDLFIPIISKVLKDYNPETLFVILEYLETKDKSTYEEKLDHLTPKGEYDIRPSLVKLKNLYDGAVKKFLISNTNKDHNLEENEVNSISVLLQNLIPKVKKLVFDKYNLTKNKIREAKHTMKSEYVSSFWREGVAKIDDLKQFHDFILGTNIFINYSKNSFGNYVRKRINLDIEGRESDKKLHEFGELFVKIGNLKNEYEKLPLSSIAQKKTKKEAMDGTYEKLAEIIVFLKEKKNPYNYLSAINNLLQYYSIFECEAEIRFAMFRLCEKKSEFKDLIYQFHFNSDPQVDLFFIACKIGYLNKAKFYLENDPTYINKQTENGISGLEYAVKNKHNEVVHSLLDNKDLSLYQKNPFGNNILHVAVHSLNYEVAIRLIESGMDLNKVNKDGQTALDIAIQKKDAFLVTLLQARGANYSPIKSGISVFINKISGSLSCTTADIPIEQHPIYIQKTINVKLELPCINEPQNSR